MNTIARTDHRTARVVDMGLEILETNGERDARWWMTLGGVPPDVIERVLHGETRRHP